MKNPSSSLYEKYRKCLLMKELGGNVTSSPGALLRLLTAAPDEKRRKRNDF